MAKSEAADEPPAAAAAAGKTAEALMYELRMLVRAITDDGDGQIEIYKEASRALERLTVLRFNCKNGNSNANSNTKKPSPLSPQKPKIEQKNQIESLVKPSPLSLQKPKLEQQNQIETLAIPDHFRCPISSELMKDPVVLAATGETYDRPFIQDRLNSGNRSCPRTEQIISDLTLVPNNILRRMISQWCIDHGITQPSIYNPDDSPITKNDRSKLASVLNTIAASSTSVQERKHAVRELRLLTKLHPSFRAVIGESSHVIPKLLAVYRSPDFDGDTEFQEDAVTTILNLSIHDSNKKTVGDNPHAILFLVECLRSGTMQTRSNAAAALFTLSALDSNKEMISEMAAMGALVELLDQGNSAAKRDAASAIFNLCMAQENRGRAVADGAVGVLLRCVEDGSLVDESLAILAMLSSNQEAVDEIGGSGGVKLMMRVMRESACGKNRENAVVVLFSVCMNDRTKLGEVREEDEVSGTITRVAESGSSRARRKAEGILNRVRRTKLNTHNSC